MLREQWTRWSPSLECTPGYRLVSLIDNTTEFTVTLIHAANMQQNVHFTFENSTLLFKKTLLSLCEERLQQLRQTYDSAFLEWSFFKITNLDYAQELEREFSWRYTASEFTHFTFSLEDSILEILSLNKQEEPIITTTQAIPNPQNEGKAAK